MLKFPKRGLACATPALSPSLHARQILTFRIELQIASTSGPTLAELSADTKRGHKVRKFPRGGKVFRLRFAARKVRTSSIIVPRCRQVTNLEIALLFRQ